LRLGTLDSKDSWLKRDIILFYLLVIIITCCIILVSVICFFVIGLVQRKVMVLDLDETLIHSHHDG